MNKPTGIGKTERLRTIRQLLLNHKLRSQEQLLQLLIDKGYKATQATLSRDLKDLQATKQVDKQTGSYTYTLPEKSDRHTAPTMTFAADEFISIDFSQNMAVIKTLSGFANAIALYIDRLELHEILGTLAGDNTIMVILRENITRRAFIESLLEHIPDLNKKVDIDWAKLDQSV
ncbi:MAG: hypothetical protein R6U66_06090 [Bacteroidales bacterium]